MLPRSHLRGVMFKKLLATFICTLTIAVGALVTTATPVSADDQWYSSCNGFWYADNHWGGWTYWNANVGYTSLTSERIMELYGIYGWECGRLSGPVSSDYAVYGYSTVFGNTNIWYRQDFACGYIVVLYAGHGDVFYNGHWHYTGSSTSTHLHTYSCIRT